LFKARPCILTFVLIEFFGDCHDYAANAAVRITYYYYKQIGDLTRYNSAIHSFTGSIAGAGTDFGLPVRQESVALSALLKGIYV
jgi:hypothetical protein